MSITESRPDLSSLTTVGELKTSGYRRRSVRQEIRENLLRKLAASEEIFPGVLGYDDTVIPELVNALLACQDLILLGLRGQAKTRILRGLTSLLDEKIPVLAGSEIGDSPFAPVSAAGKELLAEQGDQAKIEWRPRDQRYVEKLATPDTTVADLIGDLDPIRAAKGGYDLGDMRSIQYGLIPRANRGIFCMNELPDLASKVQVSLFNILQEGDVQVKGFPLRLPLDVFIVFSANPEDYTARGKIITPLKDRIGAEIRTHYPLRVEDGVKITRQEVARELAGREGDSSVDVSIPDFIWEIVESIAFAARVDGRIDARSGVSQRMPIATMLSAIANAERRALVASGSSEPTETAVRISDIYASGPAILGKLELEYEGEQIGAERICAELIRKACARSYKILVASGSVTIDPIIEHFEEGGSLELLEAKSDAAYLEELESVSGLVEAAKELSPKAERGELIALSELILEGLYAKRKIARSQDSRSKASFRAEEPQEKPRFAMADDGSQGIIN